MIFPRTSFHSWIDRKKLCSGFHLGLDIGGANLKAALISVADGQLRNVESYSTFFPLWKTPDKLTEAIGQLVRPFKQSSTVSVTMTGEIADCFASKREGVTAIVNACDSAMRCFRCAPKFYGQNPLIGKLQWSTNFIGSQFLNDNLPENYLALAASNWHAVASLFGSWLVESQQGEGPPSSGLVIDLGSTTCDITPVYGTKPLVSPATDWQRMCQGQLVYTGVGRSPLACLLPRITTRLPETTGESIGLAQELFATARDAYILLGDQPEDPSCCNTADGRPATRRFAAQRLARMFCSDSNELPVDFIQHVAHSAKANQLSNIGSAIQKQVDLLPCCRWIAVCGQGETVLKSLVEDHFPTVSCVRLSDLEGDGCSTIAPAFSVAAIRAIGLESKE